MDVSICVIGVHRSGTSMVARLLSECGIDFGKRTDLEARDSFNPEGYWEDPRFVAVNERLLAASGGDWDFPAPLSLVDSDAEKARAAKLVEPRGRPWGWKDPRTSLTLPFWRELLPDLRAVICVRNPLEVAGSLRQRNGHSQTYGLNLWLTYNQRLLEAMPKGRRIVTHYDSWFADPGAELRRISGLLQLEIPEPLLASAVATVKGGHRHQRSSGKGLAEVSFNGEILETYRALCEEAGWDSGVTAGQARAAPAASAWESRARIDAAALELEAAQTVNRDLWAQVQAAEARSRADAEERARLLAGNGQRLRELSGQLQEKERALQERDRQLESKSAEVEVLQAQVGELLRQLDAARQEWERIRSGFGWPMLEELWKWRARLIPHGSLRDQAIAGGLRLVRQRQKQTR
jgi:hypothetical protein